MKHSALLRSSRVALLVAVVLGSTSVVPADTPHEQAVDPTQPTPSFSAPLLVVPQSRIFSKKGEPIAERMSAVSLELTVHDRTATARLETTIAARVRKTSVQLVVPVPRRSKLRSLAIGEGGAEVEATVRRGRAATELWSAAAEYVHSLEPLEFARCDVVRTEPIEVSRTRNVVVTVEVEFPVAHHGERLDVAFPRGTIHQPGVAWAMSAKVRLSRPVATIVSPTHDVAMARGERGEADVVVSGRGSTPPGPFALSVLLGGDAPTATFYTVPDRGKQSGYFLMVGVIPPKAVKADADAKDAAARSTVKDSRSREVLFVLDRSGSMGGPKLGQARSAILKELARMEEGTAFHIIDFSSTVASIGEQPIFKSAESVDRAQRYLAALAAGDGTNINDALVSALGRSPAAPRSSVVLLTDGAPTAGEVRTPAILENVRAANVHKRPIHTVGIGPSVNAELLDALARSTRGSATFVADGKNLETAAGNVFERAGTAALSNARLEADTGRLVDVMPARIGALHAGEPFAVVGRYQGASPIRVALVGDEGTGTEGATFVLDPSKATRDNAFVRRTWAERRISSLVEEAAQRSRDAASQPDLATPDALDAIASQIAALALRHGIVTDHTRFLVEPQVDLSNRTVLTRVIRNTLAGLSRPGWSNSAALARARAANPLLIHRPPAVYAERVRFVRDTTLLLRGRRWVDLRILRRGEPEPDTVVDLESSEFDDLRSRLVRQRRCEVFALPDVLVLVNRRVLRIGDDSKVRPPSRE